MNKEEKNKLVPKLRFPEFRGNGEWEEKLLGQIGEFIGGGTPDTTVSEYWDGEIQWFTPTEIKEQNISKSRRTITEKGLKNSSAKLLPKGALMITTRATIGDISIANNPCTTNQGFQSLIVNDSEINIFWYYWLIQNKNELIIRASGSTFLEIGKTKIVTITTFRPSKEEQQKIATCLSSLDELITLQSQKLDALKSHKKGLMQTLFPSEGERVPKVRFKEFRGKEEWIKKLLGKVGEIITGNTPPTNDASNYGGERLFVSPADISEKRYITNTKITISDKGFALTRHIKENSVLFVCIGSTIGKIAQNKFECATNQQINSIVPYEGYSSDFLYSALEYQASSIATIAGIQAVPIINKSLFSSVLVSFPSPKEQQKIAACLSSIDSLITAQSQKIDALKEHKKGLMQGLFPAINERDEK